MNAANGMILRGARITIQGQSATATQGVASYLVRNVLQNVNKSVILTVSLAGYVPLARTVNLGTLTSISGINFVLQASM